MSAKRNKRPNEKQKRGRDDAAMSRTPFLPLIRFRKRPSAKIKTADEKVPSGEYSSGGSLAYSEREKASFSQESATTSKRLISPSSRLLTSGSQVALSFVTISSSSVCTSANSASCCAVAARWHDTERIALPGIG
jgi:hypothetical protein